MYKNILHVGRSSPMRNPIRGKATNVKISNPSADMLPYKGVAASNKPIKETLEAGKTYAWCSCGLSVNQLLEGLGHDIIIPFATTPNWRHYELLPFCDGTHKLNGLTNVRPVEFQVEKTGDYFMCNCKQTESRPICDGSHKMVSAAPKDLHATRFVMFGDNSPIYDGVAHKLGYRPKNGGFQ